MPSYNPNFDTDDDQNFSVNWSKLQELLFSGRETNVLLLIDCCHAGAIYQYARSDNVVEALCATGFEGRTPIRKDSFTQNLILKLKEQRLERKSVLASEFSDSLATSMKHKAEDSVCPIHISYSKRRANGIQLAVLPRRNSLHEPSPEAADTGTMPDDTLGDLRSAPVKPVRYYSAILRSLAERHRTDSWEKTEYRPPPLDPEKTMSLKLRKAVKHKTEYRHRAIDLDEIRLIRLYPAEDESSDLVCQINSAPFPTAVETSVKYIALSYFWGTEPSDAELFVLEDHHESPKTAAEITGALERSSLLIRPQLDGFLRQLRKRGRSVDIWVDFVCIDHNNIEEKRRIIPRMPEIFHYASGVYLWTGCATANTETVMNFVHDLNTTRAEDLVHDVELSSKWQFLINFMEQPCFNRRWVFQELAFARRIMIQSGKYSLAWSRFCRAVSAADSLFERLR